MSRRLPLPGQLRFDALLADAARDNAARQIARECSQLHDNFEEALPFFRDLTERHHAAMISGDAVAVLQMREEADRLALRLNNFEPGILAGADAPGCRLDRATRAPENEIPLWGQIGTFEIAPCGMRVRIEMEGIFGIASNIYHWLGFAAHAVEYDRPFLSETGYRSFVAIGGTLEPGFTPDRFAAAHVRRELKGRLVTIESRYRHRESARPLL